MLESLHNCEKLLEPLMAAFTHEDAHDGYWAYVLETSEAATAAYWYVFMMSWI